MSCYNNCYLPQPPRAWSRVQNSCSLITNVGNNQLTKVPLTGEIVPASILDKKMEMLNKGNILQYKANSSNLTKSQKYSKIAKGQWVNRNTTWATQNLRGYTNPNTSSLKRSGNVVNIAIDPITGLVIGQTTDPVTCPTPIIPINPGLPSNGGGGSDINDPNIPPPVEPGQGSDVFPPIIPVTPVPPIVIQDEGILICSIQENICTGETKSTLSQQQCNPTTDSDVPGIIQELCWNDGTPTWYPRQRYTMTNSTNKWPINYKGFVSAVYLSTPVITNITNPIDILLTITWTFDDTCLPASDFIIFLNDNPIKTVNENIRSTNINGVCGINNVYIVAKNTNVLSQPSNVVSIIIQDFSPPTNLTWQPQDGGIILYWNDNHTDCSSVYFYEINVSYFGMIIQSLTTTSLFINITGLTNCEFYDFEVRSVFSDGSMSTSLTLTQQILWPGPPSNVSAISGDTNCQISWSAPTTNICTNGYITYYNGQLNSGSIITNINSPYVVNGLINFQSYSFNIYSVAVINSYTCISSPTQVSNIIPESTYTYSNWTGGVITGSTGTGSTGKYNYLLFYPPPISSSTSNISFNNNPAYASSLNVVCVGAGGGGGAGSSISGSYKSGRGGGAGGCGTINLSFGFNYNFSVGYKGVGSTGANGANGGNSFVQNPSTLNDYIRCISGSGGSYGPGNSGGPSGYQSVPSITNYGGKGGDVGSSGDDADTITVPLTGIPSQLVPFPFNVTYGGGGAGSGSGVNGGAAGHNGFGGTAYGATGYDGESAITYGSGGGGAGNNNAPSGTYYFRGGDGAHGLIGFWWTTAF